MNKNPENTLYSKAAGISISDKALRSPSKYVNHEGHEGKKKL
jgi:hypothetical protein